MQRFVGGDRPYQWQKFPVARLRADQSRQSLRPAPAGDEPERRPAMRERRIGGCDASAAGQRQIKSTTHAITAHRSDHRLRANAQSDP